MRLAELLKFGVAELAAAGVESQPDARLLLESCLGLTRTELFLHGTTEVDDVAQRRYLDLIERRKRREPVAYILGEREFWSLPFYVTPAVLIPRPETEFLLDRVLALTRPANIEGGLRLDLCCGSGVIAVVLAKELGRKIIAADISGAALEVARKNLHRHRLAGLVDLVQGDLLSPFRRSREFSLIVANPPYVSDREIDRDLAPEVAQHEPYLALSGGADGLSLIREIRRQLPWVLRPDGQLFMEIGAGQGDAVRRMFADSGAGPGFADVEILADYAGRDRVLHATMADNSTR